MNGQGEREKEERKIEQKRKNRKGIRELKERRMKGEKVIRSNVCLMSTSLLHLY